MNAVNIGFEGWRLNSFKYIVNLFIYLGNNNYKNVEVIIIILMAMSASKKYTEEEWKAIQDVAAMLRAHVKDENYSYVDKLANAFNSYVAEVSIEEALRAARSKESWIPSEESVRTVIKLLREDLSVARIIAALSLAMSSRS